MGIIASWLWNGSQILQSVMGVNNILKLLMGLAPNTSLALADAVIGNRKDCGLGSKSTSSAKWSDVREVATTIVDDAAEHCKGAAGATGVLSDIARFSKPTQAINPIRSALPDGPRRTGAASAKQTPRLLLSLEGGSLRRESLT